MFVDDSFSLLCCIPLCDYTTIYFTVDGHLGGSNLAIMNSAAMDFLVNVFW